MVRIFLTVLLFAMAGNSYATNFYYATAATAFAACNATLTSGTCQWTGDNQTATPCTSNKASKYHNWAGNYHFGCSTNALDTCTIAGQTMTVSGVCSCPAGQIESGGSCITPVPDNCNPPLVKSGNTCAGTSSATDCPSYLLAKGFKFYTATGDCRGPIASPPPTCPVGQIVHQSIQGAETCATAASCTAPSALWNNKLCVQNASSGVSNVDGSIDPAPDTAATKAATAATDSATAKTQAEAAATQKAAEATAAKALSDAAKAAATAAEGTSNALPTANDLAAKLNAYTQALAKSQNSTASKDETTAYDALVQALQGLTNDNTTNGNYGQAREYARNAEDNATKAKASAGNAISGQSGSSQGNDTGQDIQFPTDYVKETTGQGIKTGVEQLKDAFIKSDNDYSGEPAGTPTIAATNQVLLDALKQRFTLPSIATITAECPVFTKTIPYLNIDLTIDQFCTMEDDIKPFIESAASVMWSIMGFLILLGA